MVERDGVVDSFMYKVDFGDVELDLDPSTDFLVRCQRHGAFLLKVVAYDDNPMSTFFLTEEAFTVLISDPVPEHPTGGNLHVVDRDYLYAHEYDGLIEARMASLEDWIEDEDWTE